jgi:hypothetical protein
MTTSPPIRQVLVAADAALAWRSVGGPVWRWVGRQGQAAVHCAVLSEIARRAAAARLAGDSDGFGR